MNEAKPVVLVIDDAVDCHRLLAVRLKHEPIELQSALTAEEGLTMARSLRPAIVLLDLDMPGRDGFEVLRALKSDATTENIPVIMLSGSNQSEDKVAAFDLGAADFVTKSFQSPGDLAELKARLRAALRLQQLVRLLSERAEVDGLTGLGNRLQFNRRWQQQVAEHRRYGHPLALAMFDVDFFKRVNDTFGHPAGDEVLQGFARLLVSCCRAADIPCRFGGEEFALIMPQTGPDDAMVVCERVRAALKGVRWPRHPEQPVTVSVGLAGAGCHPVTITPEQWIEAADKALYSAKHAGRDRVQQAAPLPAGPALSKAG